MRVNRLKLKNVRSIQDGELVFQSGFNLIVGVNGVGKTTILDALTNCLSGIVNSVNEISSRRVARLLSHDIRVGATAMEIGCHIEIGDTSERYIYKFTKQHAKRRSAAKFVGRPLYPVFGNESGPRPLAVLFSTNRAVPSERRPSKAVAAGSVAGAFAEALSDRTLRLQEFEAWMRAQQALSMEHPGAKRILDAFEDAMTRFLPSYRNLRPGGKSSDRGSLLVDHGATTLPVSQLSDGERGVLALVLDLTRRLAQANPGVENPLEEAGAIVLIDEIDLHLHPQWQRQIVDKLLTTFPRCQFIATTHSPQIIGEVSSERIHVLTEEGVFSPNHSFGMDSSRILQEIMDTDSRTRDVEEQLIHIGQQIDRDNFEDARESLLSMEKILGENDADVVRLRSLISFLEER